MEQIVIKRGNAQIPIVSRATATSIVSASQNVTLLGEDTVNIVVRSPFKQTFLIGDTITIYGNVYRLNRLPKVSKTGFHDFQYDLEFEGVQYDLMRATYDLTIDTTNNELADFAANSLTGDLSRFMDVLIANANRVFPNTWKKGVVPETASDVTITFGESDNCLSVLQNLCSQFNVEFEITFASNQFTINLKSEIGKTFPYKFEYGKNKGLYQMKRENVSSANIVTRLKVFGSTENITYKYRASRLCLPGKSKSQSFIEKPDAIAKYGVWEATKYFDVKPSFTGSVESVVSGSVLKFRDSKMTFDLKATDAQGNTLYLLDGQNAKIHFNSGNLAGYDFDVHDYNHATHEFTLVAFDDERGDVFPSDKSSAFQFGVGDEYKLLDIALPPDFENEAEQKLQNEGETWYNQNCQPKVQYGLSVTDSFLADIMGNVNNGNVVWVGDYIPVLDADIEVDKNVRVKSFKRDLLKDYSYQLTIADLAITVSTITRVISDIIDHDRIISINNLKDPTRARDNWRNSREVLNMVFDPEGDYYTDRIKPHSIDTTMLSVGATSMQFGLIGTVLQPNYNGNNRRVVITGGVLQHYAIADDVMAWELSDSDITLANDNPCYIYARCRKDSHVGSIVLDETQHTVDSDTNYYYFLIGILNSPDATNVRSIYLMYGFTTINGRFIKTGKIESADGQTYFDLDDGEIGGRIVFTSNGQKKTLAELGAEAQSSADYINATLPGILQGMTAQIDGKVETWYGKDDPSTAWTTDAERAKHVGDMWYNTETKESKRYIDNYSWAIIEDKDAKQALEDAANAQDTADGKRRVFVSTPYPPYEIGDLWVQGSTGDIMRCNVTRASGNFNSGDWVKASKYTGDENLNEFIEGYNKTISEIFDQLDGKIETWFYDYDPTFENEPTVTWFAEGKQDEHIGDLFYNTASGASFRFVRRDLGGNRMEWDWQQISDDAIARALEMAANAQDTADNKRRVFTSQPKPPYDVGDLWASGTFLKRCINSRESGNYSESDWDDATNYTGDESLNAFIDGVFDETISDIRNQIDGKLECWYSASDPSSAWTTFDEKNAHIGDQWYNTSAKRLYRYTYTRQTAFSWVEITNQDAIDAAEAAANAQDTADEKRRVFTSTPYPPYDVGDLWTDGTDLKRCINSRESGQYVASDWGLATNYTSDAALNNFINGTYKNDKSDVSAQLDGKIECWFQNADPSTGWTNASVKAKHVGDMWYSAQTQLLKTYARELISSLTMTYRYFWQTIEDKKAIDAYAAASAAQDTADGKRQVFTSTPYPPYDVGDLWVDGTDIRHCITAKAKTGSYSANDWVLSTSYDNTQTVIDGGIVTSGTVQLAGDAGHILAGITGDGTNDTSVRMWAGASKENRATAPFRVLQNGKMYATNAEIEGIIKALTGEIGGWKLSQGTLQTVTGSSYDYGNGLYLVNSLIRFLNKSGYSTKVASIGDLGVMGYDNLARFELKSTDKYDIIGSALYACCRSGDGSMDTWYPQRAFELNGNMWGYGKVCIYEEGYVGQAYTDIITSYINVTHKFHFTANTSSILAVDLPTKTSIDSNTGNKAVIFEISIVCDAFMPNTIRLRSRTGAQIYDHNGNTVSTLDMAKGDSIVFRYYAGRYHIINRNY